MNKSQFTKLSGDTSVSLLVRLLQEGRLYVSSSSDELVTAAIMKALPRIRKIHCLAVPQYVESMEKIWQEVFLIRTIRSRLLQKKGKDKGSISKFSLAAIVKFLHIRSVYSGNFNTLMKKMFGGVSMSKYVNSPYYRLSEAEEKEIMKILARHFKNPS